MNTFAGSYGYRESHKNLIPGVRGEWALAWRRILMSLIPVCFLLATPFSREYLSSMFTQLIDTFFKPFHEQREPLILPMPYFNSRFFSLCQHCSQKFHLQFFVLESWFVYFRSLLKEWNAKEDCHMPSLLFLRGALFFQNH